MIRFSRFPFPHTLIQTFVGQSSKVIKRDPPQRVLHELKRSFFLHISQKIVSLSGHGLGFSGLKSNPQLVHA